MTKLLFVNPAIRESSPPKHAPLGELWLAACLKEWYGVDSGLFDINALRDVASQDDIDVDLASAVQEEDWAAVGIGGITTTYSSIKHALKIIRPNYDGMIVLGGGGFTAQPREWMEFLPEVDVGVFGEAFHTLGEVVKSNGSLKDVRGIFYKTESGELVCTGERHDSVNMDDLPLPMYQLAPLEIYFRNSSILMSEESMTAKRRMDYCASIGCSLSCNFCYDLGLTGLKWDGIEMRFPRSHPVEVRRLSRWRSPEKCVADWKYMRERWGCDFISLLDENQSTMDAVHPSRNWIEQISDLCLKEGLQPQCVRDGVPHNPEKCSGLHFGSTAHSALVTPRFLRAAKRCGYSYFDFGFEAWHDPVLKHIKKGASLKTNVNGLIMTMRYGIRPIPNNQIGFEVEDFESLRRMVVAWEVLRIVAVPFLTTPYPGSDIWYRNKGKILEAYGGDMELFIKTLNDATEPVISISKNFTLEELLVLRFHMVRQDKDAIDQFENAWRKKRGLEPRPKDEQLNDWGRYRAEVAALAEEARSRVQEAYVTG